MVRPTIRVTSEPAAAQIIAPRDKNYRSDQKICFAADVVGQITAAKRADGCAHQNDADDQFLMKR